MVIKRPIEEESKMEETDFVPSDENMHLYDASYKIKQYTTLYFGLKTDQEACDHYTVLNKVDNGEWTEKFI